MTEAIALALLKMLLAEAPDVILWVLRKSGLVPDDSGRAPIESMKRASDVLVVNPMVKARAARVTISESVDEDPAHSDYTPPEYEEP